MSKGSEVTMPTCAIVVISQEARLLRVAACDSRGRDGGGGATTNSILPPQGTLQRQAQLSIRVC